MKEFTLAEIMYTIDALHAHRESIINKLISDNHSARSEEDRTRNIVHISNIVMIINNMIDKLESLKKEML